MRRAERLPPQRAALVLAGGLVLAILGTAPAARAAKKSYSPEQLFQPLLEGELSRWLVGPIARMASDKEIAQYLDLRSDDAARSFIEGFWQRRDPDPGRPGNPVRELYQNRAAEADKKFSEAAVKGRHTDRGTIWILYGKPDREEYEQNRDAAEPDVELWHYDKGAEPGLDGRRPQRDYRFVKLGDLTRFYSARDLRDADRRRRTTAQPGLPPGGIDEPLGVPRRAPNDEP